MIGAAKRFVKRHWPPLSLRAILFGTLLFVAALPGVGAVFLRVYENTLVQQTEAELIAQSAVLAAAYRAKWPGDDATHEPRRLAPERPEIDLRTMAILPPRPDAVASGPPDPRAADVARELAPIVADAGAVTLAATRLLDAAGIVVLGRDDIGRSYAAVPEVRAALAGRSATVLRGRDGYQPRYMLEVLSRASAIRVHHVRPVIGDGRVIGAVMLSRSPRGLFLGIYQDRGKIMFGVALILGTLILLAGLLSRGIARPIEALTRATQNVARGVVDVPHPPATAAIEIRALYENFAVMADRIERRSRYLKDVAAAVSHEFKTPIAGIRGALELIEEHGETMSEQERRRFIGNATADADRLSLLVERLLDLARADMATADAGASAGVEASIRRVSDACRSSTLAIEFAAPASLPPARISDDVLDTILETIIENSRQAGARTVTIEPRQSRGGIEIRVADDGAGVPDADRERIFEPFFTARRSSGGTGLGLAISRSLLASNGGSIDLIDSPAGATFLIRLACASTG